MNVKIKTSELKDITTKAIKGMGNNKFMPYTSLLGINIKNDKLIMISTDDVNTVQISAKLEAPAEKDISFSIIGAVFAKLVEKTSTEYIEMIIEDTSFTVKGNGIYTFSIPTDEDGTVITLEPIDITNIERTEVKEDGTTIKLEPIDITNIEGTDVKIEDIKSGYLATKNALSDKANDVIAYTGIYFDKDGVICTDSLRISHFKQSSILNPVLLYNKFASLFFIFNPPTIKVFINENDIYAYNDNTIIKGRIITDYTDFPLETIKKLLVMEIPYKVKVDKNDIKNVIDRMSIFNVDKKTMLKLDFKDGGIYISSLDNKKQEMTAYKEKTVFGEFNLHIDVQLFKPILDSIAEQDFYICYGDSNFIRIETEKTNHIFALADE